MSYYLSIFFGTFVLEDVALGTAIALVSTHKIDFIGAFAACFLGISVGDLGLYGLGFIATKWKLPPWLNFLQKPSALFSHQESHRLFTGAILVSRFLPGTRLPTYFGAGFFHYPFSRFFFWTMISVFSWVAITFACGNSLQVFFGGHWLLSLLCFFFALAILKSVLSVLLDPWGRKAFPFVWRKWCYFEFWPATLFYIPIVPYYIFLSLKYRSFVLPFYVNPRIWNGGLIGESKNDFLKHLNPSEDYTLKSIYFGEKSSSAERIQLLQQEGWQFPFVLKPDVGQRGYGVRIIHNEVELEEYFVAAEGAAILAQSFSQWNREAGILYFRKPSEPEGSIFSITDKHFPIVIADGVKNLGELILQDPRARMIAATYFARHKFQLDKVFPSGTRIQLAECGNHCQGAIFKNGSFLKSEALRSRIDAIAKSIPDFYFGRFDVKYHSEDELKAGRCFEIVEVNGAGSEATHIWDPKTNIIEAYRDLFRQWRIVFAIGAEIRAQKRPDLKIGIWSFLKESFRVYRRNDKLSVSS